MSKDQKIFTAGLIGGASLTVVVGSLVVAVKNTVKQFKLLQWTKRAISSLYFREEYTFYNEGDD